MEVKDLKIAIYGAGAMGTVLGGLLTLGGLKGVHLITRNEKHINGLNTQGAQIVCKAENRQITVPVTALLPSQMTEKYDIVFLMTKQKIMPKFYNSCCPICTKRVSFAQRKTAYPNNRWQISWARNAPTAV